MSAEHSLSHLSFSQIEKLLREITRLQKENIDLQFEIAFTKHQLEEAKTLALIESKIYSGIKKFFK